MLVWARDAGEFAPTFLDATLTSLFSRPFSRSIARVLGFLLEGDPHVLSTLEATGWLRHVRLVLAGSCRIVKAMVVQRSTVVVHCRRVQKSCRPPDLIHERAFLLRAVR
jgi:hypothetical protein